MNEVVHLFLSLMFINLWQKNVCMILTCMLYMPVSLNVTFKLLLERDYCLSRSCVLFCFGFFRQLWTCFFYVTKRGLHSLVICTHSLSLIGVPSSKQLISLSLASFLALEFLIHRRIHLDLSFININMRNVNVASTEQTTDVKCVTLTSGLYVQGILRCLFPWQRLRSTPFAHVWWSWGGVQFFCHLPFFWCFGLCFGGIL